MPKERKKERKKEKRGKGNKIVELTERVTPTILGVFPILHCVGTHVSIHLTLLGLWDRQGGFGFKWSLC